MASFTKKTSSKSGIAIKQSSSSETPGVSGGSLGSPESSTPVSRRSRRGLSSGVDNIEIDRSVPTPESSVAGSSKKKIDNKLIIGAGVGVVVVIILFTLFTRPKDDPPVSTGEPSVSVTNNTAPPVQSSEVAVGEESTPAPLTEEERLKQELQQQGFGITDTADSAIQSQTNVESDTFVKDLAGADVKELFVPKNIVYIQDFVSYTRHRAVTDEGIEIYWLDGEYKGKKCKMDIKFKHFQTLADSGVVMCNVEIVETVEGNKIITWFAPIEDPLNQLNNKKN